MHYKCMFILLKAYALVGLDWAKPMMFLLLHVTCSCIFHAYVPLILSILILICVGTFLFLSLSLSFLRLACSMAPKRKFTPSQNALHSGAASSTPSANYTPSHVRFCDEEAKSYFFENFSWCGIHSERQVILSNFFDTNLPIVIYSRGWESLCSILITCPSVIIQECYSNMHGFDYSIP